MVNTIDWRTNTIYSETSKEQTASILEGRKPFLHKIIATVKIAVGEAAMSRKPAVGSARLLNSAAAIAWHEDGEAALRVPIALHIWRLRLEPADGPVGVGVRQVTVAVGGHDDHVELPVDPGHPTAGPSGPALPRARGPGGAREPDGARLPEPGGRVREQTVRGNDRAPRR